MNTTASDVDRANPISCMTTTIVMPSEPRSTMRTRTPFTNSGSSAEPFELARRQRHVSSTLRCGNRLKFWNTVPMRCRS